MKIFKIILLTALIASQETIIAQSTLNTLTKQEKKDGWKLLFDGKTTQGWRNYNKTTIGPAWKVKDGELYLDKSEKRDGDIITDGQYENYELDLEWKIEPCGNSGIIFNSVEDPKYKYVWNTGPEVQVLDNNCHPDGKITKHRAGNLYDLIESKTENVHPAGEWNKVRIISDKGHLELWMNGVLEVETQMFTPAWTELIAGSKFKSMPDFGKSRKGHIALQDHGNMVAFRDIKIKELK